jgi:hypothetical protein
MRCIRQSINVPDQKWLGVTRPNSQFDKLRPLPGVLPFPLTKNDLSNLANRISGDEKPWRVGYYVVGCRWLLVVLQPSDLLGHLWSDVWYIRDYGFDQTLRHRVSHVMILAVLLCDYFIEAAIDFARYPYQDRKVMLLSGAVFLFIPAFVCGSVSFLIVTAIKHLLSRG